MFNSVALIGNPNCGKTTLFNALTGTHQRVGNFSGVTVEKKEGRYKKDKTLLITDLPGLYSLSALSSDERAVLSYLKQSPPQAIINVVDGTNLERNLFLTYELRSLGIPLVIAVNFCDDLEKNGIALNETALSEIFGVPVVKISAKKGVNLDKLVATARNGAKLPERVFMTKDSAAVKNGYAFIEKNIGKIITKTETRAEKVTRALDDVLTHKIWGLPIFFAIMFVTYFVVLKLGGIPGKKITEWISALCVVVKEWLQNIGATVWAESLITDGVLCGIGTVISFLPQILLLFLLLAIIEESGYAARVAFILDRFFRKFGLSGKSLLPLTISCGCVVTGLMASRTIENESERRMTVFLAPFMPCGAKTAVFAWFSAVVFGGSALVAASAYFLSLFSVALFGSILKRLKPFRGAGEGFVLEMPTLRMPAVREVFFVLWEKTKDFLFKAGTVIFTVSVALWVLKNVGAGGYTYGCVEKSFLFFLGNKLKYLFYPLGFSSWQSSVAILSGVLAKEAVAETLSLVSETPAALFNSAWSAYAFLSFVLLSPPCVSALSVAKKELNGGKWFAFMLLFQFAAAYSVAFVINLLGMLFNSSPGLIFSVLSVIIITMIFVPLFLRALKCGCAGCRKCGKGDKKCAIK